MAEQAPPVAEEEQEQSVQLTSNQDNEEGEMNSEDMEERAEMGSNVVVAKNMHDETSQAVCSKRIVCGGRYRKRCQLYCANDFCL
jgi:chaperonin GroEL (HSP60 family)